MTTSCHSLKGRWLSISERTLEFSSTESLKNNRHIMKKLLSLSLVESLQATALSQDKHLAEWAKSSTSMAWSLGPRMTAIENSQAKIINEVSSLRQDTSNIKSMMFTKEPHSHTEGKHVVMEDDTEKPKFDKVEEEPTNVVSITTFKPTETPTPKVQPVTTIISTSYHEPFVPEREGKGIDTYENLESPPKLVKASSVVRSNPNAPILVPYTINGKLFYLTEEQILAHINKED
ncbi:hypothetical protein Tco_0446454 [Tanacetum coccineum]